MSLPVSRLLQIVPPFLWCANSSRAELGWLNLLARVVVCTVLPGSSGAGLDLHGALGRLVALGFRLLTLVVGIFPGTPSPGVRVFSGLRR